MPRVAKGYIEQLLSGSFRVSVYVGTDPITRRQIHRPAWQQVTEMLTEAMQSGSLAPGDELPSITELSALRSIGTGVIRHALEVLAAHGLILFRRGQTAIVAGYRRRHDLQRPEAARTRSRLPPGWVQAARLSSDEGQHDPRHPQHLVWRIRRAAAVGMDRPQPHQVSQTADPYPSAHPGRLVG